MYIITGAVKVYNMLASITKLHDNCTDISPPQARVHGSLDAQITVLDAVR